MTRVPIHPTRVGHASIGDNQFQGFAVGAELAGSESLASMFALGVSGRRCSEEVRVMLEDVAVVLTSADPRIWPLKVTRVVASYGRTMPAFAAACGWFEDGVVGYWQSGQLAATLVQWRSEGLDAPSADTRLRAAAASFAGLGVLLREEDEKYVALRRRLAARGRLDRPYVSLLERAAESVGRPPNSFGGVAAALLDLGFEPDEVGPLATSLVLHTLMANAVEGANQPTEALRELPAECIDYTGRSPRVSPRCSRQLGLEASAVSPGETQPSDPEG